MLSGSIDAELPAAFTFMRSTSPVPETAALVSRFSVLTTAPLSTPTEDPAAVSSTVSDLTEPLAAVMTELGAAVTISLTLPAAERLVPSPSTRRWVKP